MNCIRLCWTVVVLLLAGSMAPFEAFGQTAEAKALPSLIEMDSQVELRQPGPHDGGGETTGYSFFTDAPDLGLVFRKRALHPGAAIGYHPHAGDEIYYVLSGTGELTLNGDTSAVSPGTAILTRAGSSHGLRQTGKDDLVIIIVYGKGEP